MHDGQEQKRRIKPFKALITGVIAFVGIALVFAAGVGYGRGEWYFGKDTALQKSEQKNLPDNLDYASVERVYDTLRTNYDGQLDQTKLLDGLKQGLAEATGDPYTEYFNEKASKDFNEQLDGTFSGIGAELGKDANGNVTVIAPISGYPAEKAGLRAKDVIAEIDGKTTSGMTVSDAVTKIRGKEGTKVKLKIFRNNAQELNFEITREQIKIPSVDSQILDGNIGYMKISRFGDDTADLAQQGADKFKQANVKGVILDMRDNPGGLLDAAVDVSSLWLDRGQTVLQEKRGGVVIDTKYAKGSPTLSGIPTVVLINDGSASASEITAGALNDNKKATLMGVKSYGKGSVQTIQCLSGIRLSSGNCPGASLKVTVARWFTPAGINIDKQGIEPSQKVERTEDDYKNNRDPQKDAAINFLNK